MFNHEDLDEINPLTESVAFDTLLQDEPLSEDVREIMGMKYRMTSTRFLQSGQKIEEKFSGMQDSESRF